jgi:lipoyl(octanoyl) transferase
MTRVEFIDLGHRDYKEAWDIQQDIQNRLIRAKTSGNDPDTLPCMLFVEHPHVYTLGKSGKENNLLINPQFLASINATYYKTDRGGDITYHGPGQLVGYPIFDLDRLGIGVKKYIWNLEESIILTLADFGIAAERFEGATGVWIDTGIPARSRKICAIGVKVSRGITMHGFALNVNTSLEYFSHINPCGFTDKGVTSMEKEKGILQPMQEVKQTLLKKLSGQFGFRLA